MLLDEWQIPYSFLVQWPEDCFYIKRGTYHAVINLGKNCAEAVNFGCDEWVSEYEPAVCNSKESRKNDIKQDKTVVTVRKQLKRRLHDCPEDGCRNTFTDLKSLEMHQRKVHNEVYECENCEKKYKTKKDLRHHVKMHRSEPETQCKKCGKYVLRLSLHVKSIHGEEKRCQKCNKLSKVRALQKHITNCKPACEICGRIFQSQRYLTQHKNKKHVSS